MAAAWRSRHADRDRARFLSECATVRVPARRRPNGSLSPLAYCPMAKIPASVSRRQRWPAPVRYARQAGCHRQSVVDIVHPCRRDVSRPRRRAWRRTSHNTLQFRELEDHAGHQIALAQGRRTFCPFNIGIQTPGEAGDGAIRSLLVAERAESFAGRPALPAGQPDCAVIACDPDSRKMRHPPGVAG